MISPRQMFNIVTLAVLLAAALYLLTGCSVTLPLGEDGKYGSVKVGYYAPDAMFGLAVNPSTLHDK